MDVRHRQNKTGPATGRSSAIARVLFFVCALSRVCDSGVHGQVLEIRAHGGEQSLNYDLIRPVHEFAEVEWQIANDAVSEGIAVIWSAESFVGDASTHSHATDVGLRLRMVRMQRNG